jgi:hypothetical protein
MTIPRVEDIISSLVTPYLAPELRGQLAGVDGIQSGLANASDFHSLKSWPVGGARYSLVYSDHSAVLFLNETRVGVTKFDRKLLSKKHPEKKFAIPFPAPIAEGAL